MKKKVLALTTLLLMVPAFAFAEPTTPAGGSSGGNFSTAELSTIINTITGSINVTSIVGMIAAMITACIGIVFMWWAIRKGIRVIMSAVRKGKVSA